MTTSGTSKTFRLESQYLDIIRDYQSLMAQQGRKVSESDVVRTALRLLADNLPGSLRQARPGEIPPDPLSI